LSPDKTLLHFYYNITDSIVREDANRRMAYDYADRLKAFYIQANAEEPSTYMQYFYDASGNRVKKISRTQESSSTQTTVYPIMFNLEDHLGSRNLSLDVNSSLVSKEEYYPFGETSFGSYGKKRRGERVLLLWNVVL
jgi:hypothetical protein